MPQSTQKKTKKIEEMKTLLSIKRGLEDIKNKRVKPLEEVIKSIKAGHKNI